MQDGIGKVFISHSSADKDLADRLAADLVSRGIPVWYDKLDLAIGDSVPGVINEGLASAKYFLIILSPEAVSSRWVQEEMNAALMRQVAQGGTFILPILFRDCLIPPLLQHRRYADFRTNYENGLIDLLSLWKKDAETSDKMTGRPLFPWPNPQISEKEFVYLHSTRFDKFFCMGCDLSSKAGDVIERIVETLSLPRNQEIPNLGMKWSFSYGLVYEDNQITLSKALRDVGIQIGSILQLSIRGTYEDLWERELRDMWDGNKMYEIGGALQRDAKLRKLIKQRGLLTTERVREIANSCFAHV